MSDLDKRNADLMQCGHPKGCKVSSEDSACGWCQHIAHLQQEVSTIALHGVGLLAENERLKDALRELHDFAEPSAHHRYQDRSKKAFESAAALLKETETE